MKTDYSTEIETLLSSAFKPATAVTENSQPKTLEELHLLVINVLPAKWIYQKDVYDALEKQGFKVSFGKNEKTEGFFYFVANKL